MTRSREPSTPIENPAEEAVRSATAEAREGLSAEPGPVRRTLRALTSPLRRPSVLFFLGLAGAAAWLAWYFRSAGDRVPLTPFMADAARTTRIVAPLGTETPRITPARTWTRTP